MQQINIKQSNSLVFKTSKVIGNKNIFVKIRLDDECKNGHQDFSITGSIYEADKPKIDKYLISCGCIHDEILKYFPEYKIFINLHLCDYLGNPMHAIENMFYHLQNGFNNTPIESNNFMSKFCSYYRINTKQFNELKRAENKTQFAAIFINLDIVKQWKAEAKKGIKLLEELTGTQFIIDSKRTNLTLPTLEELKEEEEKQKNGYYSDEKKAEREAQRINNIIEKLESEYKKECDKALLELESKKAVLKAGGSKALENCIFYTHTKQISFNWRSYDKISEELINKVKTNIILPKGVTISNN